MAHILLRKTPHIRRFKVEAELHSTHQPIGGLTVATYVNLEPLHFLEALCASWEGPMIAAAYVPLISGRASDLDSALPRFQDMFSKCAQPRQQARSRVMIEGAVVNFKVRQQARSRNMIEGAVFNFKVVINVLINLSTARPTAVLPPPCTCRGQMRKRGIGSSTDLEPEAGTSVRQATCNTVSPALDAPQPSLYATRYEPLRQTSAFKKFHVGLSVRRIDAETDGCQLDLIVYSELVDNDEVRRCHHPCKPLEP